MGAAADVTSAQVRLFGGLLNTAVPSTVVGLYPVASTTWTESGLTWNTRPAAGATPVATATAAGTAGTYYAFDVTAYVKQQRAAGATAVAFAVKGAAAGEGWAGFGSDEAGAADRPQLDVFQNPGGPSPVVPTVAGLTLVNADTDKDVGPLADGQLIDLTAAGSELAVRANPGQNLGSVVFVMDGDTAGVIETYPPLAYPGDAGGDYQPWTPAVGRTR